MAYSNEETAPTYDRVTLSASAESDVPNDLLSAELFIQREGADAAQLAREVNAAVEWALEQSKKIDTVKMRTLDYRTHPLYKEQMLTGWRVRQAISLESADTSALSDLVGVLQERLALDSIAYKLSPAQREQAENTLIQSALASFMRRAKLITEQFGRSEYRLVNLDVSNSGVMGPRPMYRNAMVMRADAAAPAIEAGSQTVKVQVNGVIELKVQ
jgi:predicted secreted protein